jgi:hypothetical protein
MSATDFLKDYADVEPFAAEAKREPRTIRRWMKQPNGLPYVKLGNRVLIHIPTARAWLASRMCHPNPRRVSQS